MAKAKGTEITRGLKALFIIHGIGALVSGLIYLLLPLKWAEISNYGPIDHVFVRYFGAVTVALSFKDWVCLRAKGWVEVRISVIMEVVWTLLATLLSFYLVLFGSFTAPASII